MRSRRAGSGFASQSGALGSTGSIWSCRAGLGVSRWISTGNECDVDIAASIRMLVDDPLTKVIGAYVEDVKDGPAFGLPCATPPRQQAGFRDQGRPFLGRRRSRQRHTQARWLAKTGSTRRASTSTARIRVASVTEMIDAAKLVLRWGAGRRGSKIGVLSVSGGAGVLLADAIESAGLGTRLHGANCRSAVEDLARLFKPHNPVDLTANVLANTEMFRKTLSVVSAAPELKRLHPVYRADAFDFRRSDRVDPLGPRDEGQPSLIVVWIGARPKHRRETRCRPDSRLSRHSTRRLRRWRTHAARGRCALTPRLPAAHRNARRLPVDRVP